jgi:hypothetical protein
MQVIFMEKLGSVVNSTVQALSKEVKLSLFYY